MGQAASRVLDPSSSSSAKPGTKGVAVDGQDGSLDLRRPQLHSEGVVWQNYEIDASGRSETAWQIKSKSVEYDRDMHGGTALSIVGEIRPKGVLAYRFFSEEALVECNGASMNVQGRIYVQDLAQGLQLRGEAMTWNPVNETLRLHDGVAACRGPHFCMSAPALWLTNQATAQTGERSRSRPVKQFPEGKLPLKLNGLERLNGTMHIEGPTHAWVVSPSTIIGGMQAAQKQARQFVSKIIDAPAIVSQPWASAVEKPICTPPRGVCNDSSAIKEDVLVRSSGEKSGISSRRSQRGRGNVEIQIEAKDGLTWDLSGNTLASDGNISVWCHKVLLDLDQRLTP